MTAAIPLCIVPAKAQFNTVATIPARYKVEVLRTDMNNAGATLENEAPVQGASTDILASADIDKKRWIDRYLSVSYPLSE